MAYLVAPHSRKSYTRIRSDLQVVYQSGVCRWQPALNPKTVRHPPTYNYSSINVCKYDLSIAVSRGVLVFYKLSSVTYIF